MNESISILSIFLLVNMTLITSTCHAQNRSDYPWGRGDGKLVYIR